MAAPHQPHIETPVLPERPRFIKPTLPDWKSVQKLYAPAYASGLITNGALVERLEQAVSERLGVKHCVAVSSCTSGLILTMKALDLGGDVILPSFTFFASGEALLWNRLRPVFADCCPRTWTIDAKDVVRRITPGTSAILGVHLYGNPCDVTALSTIAAEHNLKLIFDAAHAFGSYTESGAVGGFGDAEVFSLSPTKLLVAGEGGLVTTNDAVLARRLRAARNYGDLGPYDPELLGLNARMPELNAAMALAGLEGLDAKIAQHNHIARLYTTLLSDTRGISFQRIHSGDRSTYKDYSVYISERGFGMSSRSLASQLSEDNIETKKYFYPPLHRQKLFSSYYTTESGSLPITEVVSEGILSLPIYESLTDSTVMAIAGAIASRAHDNLER